jgi:hypothetical protein
MILLRQNLRRLMLLQLLLLQLVQVRLLLLQVVQAIQKIQKKINDIVHREKRILPLNLNQKKIEMNFCEDEIIKGVLVNYKIQASSKNELDDQEHFMVLDD